MTREAGAIQDDQHGDSGHQDGGHDMRTMYLRFGAMIATSIVVMYLVTYLNVFDVAHIRFSEERVYIALTMGGAGSSDCRWDRVRVRHSTVDARVGIDRRGAYAAVAR